MSHPLDWVFICDVLKVGYIPPALAEIMEKRMVAEVEAAGETLMVAQRGERTDGDKSLRLLALASIFSQ